MDAIYNYVGKTLYGWKFMFLAILLFSVSSISTAKPLVELTESFGETVVPYHHSIGRKKSFQQINASINRKGYGPRTYVRSDVHEILAATFKSLQSKPLKLVYGEGSWGEAHINKSLKPHKTHKNGMYLDIFMPLNNRAGTPVYFPITKENLFGYAVNFTKKGTGQGTHTNYQIDWVGLITLFDALCTHGGDHIKKILIAEDLIPALQDPILKEHWAPIPQKCRTKLHPIRVLGPYKFAGRDLLVDHDDHIHVEFH